MAIDFHLARSTTLGWRRSGCSSCQVLSSNLIKEHAEYQDCSSKCLERNGMTKDNCGNTNGKHLPGRHDNGKHNRSKLLDGIKDAKLTRRRCDCSDNIVLEHHGIGSQEFPYNGKISSKDKTRSRNANC